MEIITEQFVRGMSVLCSSLVMYEVLGRTYGRAKVKGDNPQTPEQQAVRSYVSVVSKAWKQLTAAQRAAWEEYGTVFPVRYDILLPAGTLGFSCYLRSNVMRLILGYPVVTDAPLQAPPREVESIALGNSHGLDDDTLALTVTHTHTHTQLDGKLLLVRMTSAQDSVAITPDESDYRLVCGPSVESTAPLPESGGEVIITPVRYAVHAGELFGVEVRVLRTSDGALSPSVVRRFVK